MRSNAAHGRIGIWFRIEEQQAGQTTCACCAVGHLRCTGLPIGNAVPDFRARDFPCAPKSVALVSARFLLILGSRRLSASSRARLRIAQAHAAPGRPAYMRDDKVPGAWVSRMKRWCAVCRRLRFAEQLHVAVAEKDDPLPSPCGPRRRGRRTRRMANAGGMSGGNTEQLTHRTRRPPRLVCLPLSLVDARKSALATWQFQTEFESAPLTQKPVVRNMYIKEGRGKKEGEGVRPRYRGREEMRRRSGASSAGRLRRRCLPESKPRELL